MAYHYRELGVVDCHLVDVERLGIAVSSSAERVARVEHRRHAVLDTQIVDLLVVVVEWVIVLIATVQHQPFYLAVFQAFSVEFRVVVGVVV